MFDIFVLELGDTGLDWYAVWSVLRRNIYLFYSEQAFIFRWLESWFARLVCYLLYVCISTWRATGFYRLRLAIFLAMDGHYEAEFICYISICICSLCSHTVSVNADND